MLMIGGRKSKKVNRIIILIFFISALASLVNYSSFAGAIDPRLEGQLTEDEKLWLNAHKNEVFSIGLDPIAGMEYFLDENAEKGYLKNVADLLSEKLNLKMNIMPELSWNESVEGLSSGDIQILFGANPTQDRLKFMDFTNEIYSVPYTLISQVDGPVQNIGDINDRLIGFLDGDAVTQLFKDAYPNLHYENSYFDNQEDALVALNNHEIDAFITSGGDVVYDYLFRYPNLKVVANLEEIRSLLTFSALKSNALLISTLSKAIVLCEADITEMIDDARKQFVRKILNLSPAENKWLDENEALRVGVPTDYLPIDYYEDGHYNGIAGHYLNTFADLIGIEIIAVPASFDKAYEMIVNGEIDVLNMAKTEERLNDFIFTDAFSNERDQIYGHRNTVYVHDIYGLEGKKVAAIEGFWHIDHLNLNLRNPQIIIVSDIQEAIEAVNSGRADYFIETPAVAEYYISGLGYTNIIKKGETSSDSYLTFGALKKHAPLVSLFNRTKLLINYDNSKYLGVLDLPELKNVTNRKLGLILVGVSLVIVFLMLLLLRLQRDLFLTKERERLIYIDPLTGIYNRNYFNLMEKEVDLKPFAQNIFMLDINDLKYVNDQYGHLNGDRMIDAVSSIVLHAATRYHGLAMRMGGDEFILCFFGTPPENNTEIAAFLIESFKTTALYDREQLILTSLEVAVGYSSRGDNKKTFEDCFKEADQAMYLNKALMKDS